MEAAQDGTGKEQGEDRVPLTTPGAAEQAETLTDHFKLGTHHS